MSNDRLLEELARLVTGGRELTALLVAHIEAVDARRLYRREACASMFAYCTEVLRMSEHAAYTRIRAARTARTFPIVVEMLGRGEIHLTTVRILAPHLTSENHLGLLRAARHKSKKQVEELAAAYAPRPDVAAGIRKLPSPRLVPEDSARNTGEAPLSAVEVAAKPTPAASTVSAPTLSRSLAPLPRGDMGHLEDRAEPLSADRFKVQFTAERALRDKIEEAQTLLRGRIPTGDLAAVFDEALTVLIRDLRRRRFGATRRPREAKPLSPGSRHVPNAVKRAVDTRDGGSCRFTDASDRRCTERAHLEYHHVEPFARGGPTTTENIVLLCRSHNAYEAEREFGFRHAGPGGNGGAMPHATGSGTSP